MQQLVTPWAQLMEPSLVPRLVNASALLLLTYMCAGYAVAGGVSSPSSHQSSHRRSRHRRADSRYHPQIWNSRVTRLRMDVALALMSGQSSAPLWVPMWDL